MEDEPESIYDVTVKDAKGSNVHFSVYHGKVLLIVNLASKCGMTNSNYTELNQLYEKYYTEMILEVGLGMGHGSNAPFLWIQYYNMDGCVKSGFYWASGFMVDEIC